MIFFKNVTFQWGTLGGLNLSVQKVHTLSKNINDPCKLFMQHEMGDPK